MHIIIVQEKSTGKIVDRAEIETTSPGIPAAEIDKLTAITKSQFLKKYPPDKFLVIAGQADNPDALQRSYFGKFRMEGSASNMLVTNISGAMLGAILLFFLLSVRLLFSPALFLVMFLVLAAYMVGDYLLWQGNGVRAVEIDRDSITIFRGKGLKPAVIDQGQITGINVISKLKRRIVTILTGGKEKRVFPGVTIFTGSRTRIAEDAFNDLEFSEFIERLKRFQPAP
jgi:hypothetical protein